MSKSVRLTFTDGLIEAEALGFRGKGCEQAVDDLLRKLQLDPTTAKREPTPEFQLPEHQGETTSE